MWMNLLLLVALACSLVAADTDIVTLDASNFEHLTQAATGATTGDWLIKFYAPWCGHCKAMQPEYELLATQLKGEANVAEVDVAKDRSIGSRFDIKGFPTLLFLSGGKVYKYKGPRTADALSTFVRGGYKDVAVEADVVSTSASTSERTCTKTSIGITIIYATLTAHARRGSAPQQDMCHVNMRNHASDLACVPR